MPLAMHATDANRAYLEAKRDRMGHHLPGLDVLHDLTDPVATTEELRQ